MKINKRIVKIIRTILFVAFFVLNSLFCYIIIPIKYISINELIENNPSNIINNILKKNLYGIIEIGSPKQTVDIRIEFDSNDFYISKNNSIIHKNDTNFFSKLKKYNSYKSNSLTILEEGILFRVYKFNKKEKDLKYLYSNLIF